MGSKQYPQQHPRAADGDFCPHGTQYTDEQAGSSFRFYNRMMSLVSKVIPGMQERQSVAPQQAGTQKHSSADSADLAYPAIGLPKANCCTVASVAVFLALFLTGEQAVKLLAPSRRLLVLGSVPFNFLRSCSLGCMYSTFGQHSAQCASMLLFGFLYTLGSTAFVASGSHKLHSLGIAAGIVLWSLLVIPCSKQKGAVVLTTLWEIGVNASLVAVVVNLDAMKLTLPPVARGALMPSFVLAYELVGFTTFKAIWRIYRSVDVPNLLLAYIFGLLTVSAETMRLVGFIEAASAPSSTMMFLELGVNVLVGVVTDVMMRMSLLPSLAACMFNWSPDISAERDLQLRQRYVLSYAPFLATALNLPVSVGLGSFSLPEDWRFWVAMSCALACELLSDLGLVLLHHRRGREESLLASFRMLQKPNSHHPIIRNLSKIVPVATPS